MNQENTKKLVQRCVETISGNSRLRNQFRSASSPNNDALRHDIAVAWYEGYRAGNPNEEIPNETSFVDAALPEIKTKVASAA